MIVEGERQWGEETMVGERMGMDDEMWEGVERGKEERIHERTKPTKHEKTRRGMRNGVSA